MIKGQCHEETNIEASPPNMSTHLKVNEWNIDNSREIFAPSPKKIFKSSQAYQSQSNSQSEARIAVTPEEDDFEETNLASESSNIHVEAWNFICFGFGWLGI